MNHKSRMFISCLFTCLFYTITAQKPDFTFIKQNDGLSSNIQWSTNAVAVDKKGFVWYITMGGLNRWDGYNVKSYTKVSNDNRDLPNNLLTAIVIDKDDNLWLGTQEEGIIFFDTKRELFTPVAFKQNGNDQIVFRQINKLIIDRHNGLYILGGFQGLFKYDITTKKLEAFTKLNTKIGGNASNFILTKNNKILVGATNGMYYLHSKDTLDHYPKPYEKYIRSILELPDGTFHIFLQNVKSHYILDQRKKTFVEYPNKLPHLALNGWFDKSNNLWISYMDGILTKENLLTHDMVQYPNFTKLYNNDVPVGLMSMSTTADDKTYFMSLGSGAGIIDHNQKLVTPFLSNEYGQLQIIGNDFYCTKGHTLFKWSGGKMTKVAQLEDKYADNYIHGYHISKRHGIWISHVGHRASISHFDYNGKLLQPGLPINCGATYSDAIGDSLIWDYNHGINPKLPIKFVGKYFTDLSGKKYPDFAAKHYKILKNGDIWVATFNDGIYRVYDGRQKYEVLQNKNNQAGYLKSNNPYYIFEHSNGEVYVCTDMGIDIWDPKVKKFNPLNLPDHISSSKFLSMIEDLKGRTWILLNDRLLCYDPSSKQLFLLPLEDQHNIEAQNHLQIDSQGYIYFQGYNGIFKFDPEKFLNSKEPNDVIITDLFVNRERVYPSDAYYILDTAIMIQQNITVPYKYRDLGFSFVSIDGKDHDVTYYYKLNGYQHEWTLTKAERTIHFTNLDPGSYTFEVKAVAGNGKSSKISTISIKVTPPWYQRWYAYLLYFVTLSSIMYTIYRYRINQILRYHNLRTKISSDLHDDVGSILTGIAMQSEMMTYTQDEQENSLLTELSQMSRDAMERMRDIVWALDSNKDKYENLIDRMRAFAEQQLPLKNISHEFTIDEVNGTQSIAPDVRQNVYLIFKEAITNIVKHSNGDKVVITFTQQNGKNILTIADNGTTTPSIKSDGSGLLNMNQRAVNIGGRLDIDKSNGYVVRVEFRYHVE
jgi:ligand-binding sensor domain-containing protein/two-component sensor histidine kinase